LKYQRLCLAKRKSTFFFFSFFFSFASIILLLNLTLNAFFCSFVDYSDRSFFVIFLNHDLMDSILFSSSIDTYVRIISRSFVLPLNKVFSSLRLFVIKRPYGFGSYIAAIFSSYKDLFGYFCQPITGGVLHPSA